MRFYTLTLTEPVSGLVWKPTATADGFVKSVGGNTFSSLDSNGRTIPGALNLEFDSVIYGFDQPQGGARLAVWGVGLGMIGQAANLNGSKFQLSAGMAAGLPLANPSQAGLIAEGTIFQAYGNWQGVNQTLELICNPGIQDTETSISFSWVPGQQLSDALTTTFYQAFGELNFDVTINISANLTPKAAQYGTYNSLQNFASYITQYTQALGQTLYGPNYSGVVISFGSNTLYASDGQGSIPAKLVPISFQDMVGQPTWSKPNTVSFKTVLRADIGIGNHIQFAQGAQSLASPYVLTSQGMAYPNVAASSKTAFQGTFNVTEVHHYANSRQPDGDSWATAFTADALPVTGTAYLESSPGFDAT